MATAFKRNLSGPVCARSVHGRDLHDWAGRIDRAARAERKALAVCFAVGVALNAAVIGACELLFRVAARFHPPAVSQRGIGLIVGGAVCVLMLLVAVLTKPDGRAETASRVLDSGFHITTDGPDPVHGVLLAMLMFVALYGSYAVVGAIRRAIARVRLASVDRSEMARVLAAASAVPVGVSVGSLLKTGQRPEHLRRPVAALLLDGWVTLQDGGRVIEQTSPAARRNARRRPLADVFGGRGR